MHFVSSFSYDDRARGGALCFGITIILEQRLISNVDDKVSLLQLMVIVAIYCNTAWGMSVSGAVIYLVLPVSYNKCHVN